jgi:hypothetical protein
MSKTRTKPRNTMAARMRNCPNPGFTILRATRKRLFEMWDNAAWQGAERMCITDAIALVDLAISRVNSTLEV